MVISESLPSLTATQSFIKRSFDVILSLSGLLALWWLIFFSWLLASLDTRSNGFFVQQRVGLNGRLFSVIKIKTMRPMESLTTTVTQSGDPRITKIGSFLRKVKIDELPQLWNVLVGEMSFVGPRPDVPGFADTLQGEDWAIATIRPGITGPATLKYRNEEKLLADQVDPEHYNKYVIYPDKVAINLRYIKEWSFTKDLVYIVRTAVR